jgi:hypothetical protein
VIISASRRTDIPAFYSQWFLERIRAGYCTVPNPFNAKQVSTVSLAPEDVDAIVFWTRNPRPLLAYLPELDERGHVYVFQYTLLDYPRWLEKNTPPVDAAIAAFREVAARIGPNRVIWRYDPLVFTRSIDADFHRGAFSRLAGALRGSTERVVVSIMDDYAKSRGRLSALDDETPQSKESACAGDAFGELMRDLAGIAGEHGMQIQSCAETLDLRAYGIEAGKCIDDALLNRLFNLNISATKDPTQRTYCGCVISKDIGMYNSCPFGCQYCYATASFETARTRYARHDAYATSLFVPENA